MYFETIKLICFPTYSNKACSLAAVQSLQPQERGKAGAPEVGQGGTGFFIYFGRTIRGQQGGSMETHVPQPLQTGGTWRESWEEGASA